MTMYASLAPCRSAIATTSPAKTTTMYASLAPCRSAIATTSPAKTTMYAVFSPRRPRRSSIGTASIVRCSSFESPSPSLADFEETIQNHQNLVPMYKLIFSDRLTPVLAYRCLVREDLNGEMPSFLFESIDTENEVTSIGRYSVMGCQPCVEIVAEEKLVTVIDHIKGESISTFEEDPMLVPRRLMDKWNPPQLIDDLPDVFTGGWVGYFSYDTVRYVEKKKLSFWNCPVDDRHLPDIHLGLYDNVVVLDHLHKRAFVIHWVQLERFSSYEEAYNDGKNQLEALVAKLENEPLPRLGAGSMDLQKDLCSLPQKKVSSMTDEQYQMAVLLAKEHILAGNIFQMVLSRRFERKTLAHPFDVYRALRNVNPSPYLTYLQCRGCILVGSSPQIFTRVKKGKITVRPLAGTIRRGKTADEDKKLSKELLTDEKACAEHIMLVDLARNDVGKVSKHGSVKVEKLMAVEQYSHVMHISSTVTGELLDNLSSWDALRAALPAGTVTGAPKVKAMELIDQLEATRRGPYSGAFGGISFSGDMDLALTLTTIIFPTGLRSVHKQKDWIAHIQAGTGIVADSNPRDEQTECENKTAPLFSAIELAESSFLLN